MRVFAISGFSNSGKTTLITSIVKELTNRGIEVITIKSTQEDAKPPDGTDTSKHLEAGAKASVLIGPSSTMTTYDRRLEFSEFAAHFDVDFVLVEGLKSSQIPKIWIDNDEQVNLEKIAPRTVAVVSRNPDSAILELPTGTEIVQSSNIDRIIEIIEEFATELGSLKL
ncbi:MAG: molybdopterin-guanine dinucleotide biosynthesis protein B [Candidatus Thorarchaeota archaeon]